MKQEFELLPWRSAAELESNLPDLKITGWIDRSGDILEIQYQLIGDLDAVAIAAPVGTPSRRFELWEATCLEFFLAPIGQHHYWEFNLSPSGDWNVFRLDDYRQGLRNEEQFQTLPFEVTHQNRELSLFLRVDLGGLIEACASSSDDRHQPLVAGVTTVIQNRAGDFSYWALCHPGPEADFHRRDSFTIGLLGTVS
jgi:hypothetical protein